MRTPGQMLNITPKRETTRGTLCAAMQSRRVIEFYYHGGYRTVEPFGLGVTLDGDADNESLLCYQTGGYSEFNSTEGWKLYRAAEIEDIKILNEQFAGDRPGYDPDNIDMVKVFGCVQPEKPKENTVKKTAASPPVPVTTHIAPVTVTHDERMRRFRFTHPLPAPSPALRPNAR